MNQKRTKGMMRTRAKPRPMRLLAVIIVSFIEVYLSYQAKDYHLPVNGK